MNHSLLKLSDACSLALHALAILAGPDSPLAQTGAMAQKLGASEHHLSKVLQRLHRAGLVEAKRGPNGGFMLTQPATQVRLLDVYEAIDGPVPGNSCLLGRPMCKRKNCILGGLSADVQQSFIKYFSETTLADLAATT